MQDGVVIFSQKDVDQGLMEIMEAFANDWELSVADMVKQIFARRIAEHIAHFRANGYHEDVFYEDKALATVGENGHCIVLIDYLVNRIMDDKHKPSGVLQ